MAVELREKVASYKPKFFPFPENPKIVTIDGIAAYEYITPEDTDKLIENFSNYINLNWFDAILVNKDGGVPFALDLISILGAKKPIEFIKYRENGQIITPVPNFLRDAHTLTVDDIFDQGITGNLILEDAPHTTPLYLTKKRDVPNQKPVRRALWLSEIVNKWVLGKGMNGDTENDGYPLNWGRTYRGIAVKILTP